jgi:hypothetical protein
VSSCATTNELRLWNAPTNAHAGGGVAAGEALRFTHALALDTTGEAPREGGVESAEDDFCIVEYDAESSMLLVANTRAEALFAVPMKLWNDSPDPTEWGFARKSAATKLVRVLLCTVTFYANLAHSLTRSP